MPNLGDELRTIVDEAVVRLRRLTDAQSICSPAPGKWSPTEVVGHLIDSASNNHRRFVEAQHRDDLVFPGYEHEAWVTSQRYRQAPWESLVELWRLFNHHLARVIDAVPAGEATRSRARHNLHEIAWGTFSATESVTLERFMADYVGHLRHHLGQIATPD